MKRSQRKARQDFIIIIIIIILLYLFTFDKKKVLHSFKYIYILTLLKSENYHAGKLNKP